jgi:protein ImuB
MTRRRFLSLWFPRLAAERALRRAPDPEAPLAVVAEDGPARVLSSLSAAASAAGLTPGQPLRDALAICPGLVTRPADPPGEAAFLDALRRHAVRFSPRVAAAGPDGLDADITGVAHLFGGEAALAQAALADAGRLGLTLRIGIADTPGAARALARFGPGDARAPRAGPDGAAIAEEARATRARAAAPPRPAVGPADGGAGIAIAPVGELYGPLAPLPVAALGVAAETAAGLARLGLRTVGDIAGLPRAALARRFGPALRDRLDRALGHAPEPVSPPAERPRFAVRLNLPEPLAHQDAILAGLDRLLAALCGKLEAAGRGARTVTVELLRAGGGVERLTVRLARATARAATIRGLIALKLDGVTAGFGFDALRMAAPLTEPVSPRQAEGHLAAGQRAREATDALSDLIARIGTRIGPQAVTWLHPADSHIPEKTAHAVAAAWADPAPAGAWPRPAGPRPARLFPPEPVAAPAGPASEPRAAPAGRPRPRGRRNSAAPWRKLRMQAIRGWPCPGRRCRGPSREPARTAPWAGRWPSARPAMADGSMPRSRSASRRGPTGDRRTGCR